MALTGRAAVLDKPFGTFTVEEAVVPEVDPGGIIIRQEMTGVCGTDAHLYEGRLFYLKYPIVMGHEVVGTIERLGPKVKTDSSGRPVKEGDRVYIIPGTRCGGTCYYCSVLLQPNLCLGAGGFGFRPYPDQPIHFQGGFADYQWLKEGTGFLKVETDAQTICALEPLAIATHVVTQYHFRPGETVAVQGAGAIGQLVCMVAKATGATKVIVIGAPESRLELAKRMGADVAINIEDAQTPAERVALVQKETEGSFGADVVIECTGVPAATVEGIDMLRRGGTYLVAGHFTDSGNVEINPFAHITRKNITLRGIWSSERTHFVRARSLVESGKYPMRDVISHVLPLERLGDAIEAMRGRYRLDGEEIRKIGIASAL